MLSQTNNWLLLHVTRFLISESPTVSQDSPEWNSSNNEELIHTLLSINIKSNKSINESLNRNKNPRL